MGDKMIRKYKNLIYIVAVLGFIVMSIGITYSYFIYEKDVVVADLTAGSIGINFVGEKKTITSENITSSTDGQGKVSNPLDFSIEAIADTEEILYEVELVQTGLTSEQLDHIKIYLTDQSDNEVLGIYTYNELIDSKKNNGKMLNQRIVEGNPDGTAKTTTNNYRIRIWLDEGSEGLITNDYQFDIYLYAVNINKEDYHKLTFNSDDNRGTYTYKYVKSGDDYGDFPNISGVIKWLKGEDEVNELTGFVGIEDITVVAKRTLSGVEKVLRAISTNATGTCSDIIYEEDGIKYFSGTNDCINFNYVWYSGKLWRITAIYPDGSMKLITENNITTIAFNESSNVNFENSYMQMWLNEEFYPTLYNTSNIIDTTKKWNATSSDTESNNDISMPLSNTTLITANVGLLNSYEYYNSYRNLVGGSYSGRRYLGISNYDWWLLNPINDSRIWGDEYGRDPNTALGVRPSVYFKSGLEFTGSGTIIDPYKIVGDKDSGVSNEFVNTRISGEYVKLKNGSNEQLFRIIDVEDSKTKIIAMDYADNKGVRPYTTAIADWELLWGGGSSTDTGTWYDYLNSTYLPNLKSTYGELFDSSTYYLGTTDVNYKLSVCANTTSGDMKLCTKTSDKGTFDIGLPRYGEMFAAQQSGSSTNSIDMFLINRATEFNVWGVNSSNLGAIDYSASGGFGARPTLHLKSTVKILSGSGTENDPYIVGL